MHNPPDREGIAADGEWVGGVVDMRFHISQDSLDARKWIGVPVESGLHFNSHDASLIAHAAKAHGAAKLRSILLEELIGVPNSLDFDTTENGLMAFQKVYGHWNVALVPSNRSFLVICTTDDYYLLAGSCSFVEMASGMTSDKAYLAFKEFALDSSWKESSRDFFLSVLHSYSKKCL